MRRVAVRVQPRREAVRMPMRRALAAALLTAAFAAAARAQSGDRRIADVSVGFGVKPH